MQRLVAVVLVVAVLLAGCTSTQHLAAAEDHPWHTVPAKIGFGVFWIVMLPIVLVFTLSLPDSWLPDQHTGIPWIPATGVVLLGYPFYVLGLPFEGGEPEYEAPRVNPQDPSDEVLRQRDEVIEDAQRGDP